MIKIIIAGCNGYMGRVVESICNDDTDVTVVAGFDLSTRADSVYPIFANPMDFTGEADAVIDFPPLLH